LSVRPKRTTTSNWAGERPQSSHARLEK
jgi:hypothetical protein